MEDEEILRTKQRIIASLRDRGHSLPENVVNAFFRVDRAIFVPPSQRSQAYLDRPLPIGHGQTISAIHMVLMMLTNDTSNPKPGDWILEVGTGSGYNAAILAASVDPEEKGEGLVVSIERIPSLSLRARRALLEQGLDTNLHLIIGDGSMGVGNKPLFDSIIITAAAPAVPPPLLDNLKPGGRLVAPVGSRYIQTLKVVTKRESGDVYHEQKYSVMFVPLIGEHGFKE